MIQLLILSVILASANSILLHKTPKGSDTFNFTLIGASVWTALLFIVSKFTLRFTKETLLWGIAYGVLQMLFLFFKTKAMATGPVSLTTVIGNCSLLLSTSVGAFFWREPISLIKIFGMVMLVAAFFFCTYTKKGEKSSRSWIIYCVFFFIFAACVGIIFKAFSKLAPQADAGSMMIIASITMVIVLAVQQMLSKAYHKSNSFKITSKYFIIAVICGVISCAYNRLNIYLAGNLPSAIFYPCFNGGVILLSIALGILLLKEKLNINKAIGLATGTLAVIIISIG